MKNVHGLVLGLFFTAVACSEAQEVNQTVQSQTQESTVSSQYEVVGKAKFQEMMATDGAQLIDVRTPEEFNGGHIEGATNWNFMDGTFESNLTELDKSKPVLVYCAAGGRSGRASKLLQDKGFEVIYDLQGGYSNW